MEVKQTVDRMAWLSSKTPCMQEMAVYNYEQISAMVCSSWKSESVRPTQEQLQGQKALIIVSHLLYTIKTN